MRAIVPLIVPPNQAAIKDRSKKDPLFKASLIIFAIIVVAAVVGPWLAPYDPYQLYAGEVNNYPTLQHIFGTDDLGRDIFSRALEGARASVFAPIGIVILSTVFGVTLAVVAAWFGGTIRGTIARIIDVIFAIPGLVLAVLAVAMFGKGLVAPVIALSVAYIPVVARLTQTAASRELGKPYIAALRVQGV